MTKSFSTIDEAIRDIRNGRMVLVVDDMSEETEGNLIKAAELVTAEDINFFIRKSGGMFAGRNAQTDREPRPRNSRPETDRSPGPSFRSRHRCA